MSSKATEQELRKYLSTPTKVFWEQVVNGFIYLSLAELLIFLLYEDSPMALIPVFALCVFEGFHIFVLVRVYRYLRRAEGTDELEDVLADFATATPAMGDRVRLGDRWIFGSASGAPVRMANITKLYENRNSTLLDQTLLCAEVSGDSRTYTLCIMPPKSRFEDDCAAVVRYVAHHAPHAAIISKKAGRLPEVGDGAEYALSVLAGAESEEELLASGHWGNCVWAVDAAGALVVSSGEGAPCDGSGPWAQVADRITSVTLRSDVVLPTCCAGLFAGCTNLLEANTRYWDVSRVTDLSYLFAGCSSLTLLDVERWNTSQVRHLCCSFDGCASLLWLDVSKWDTSHVRDMAGVFWGCRSLDLLDLSHWDTRQVQDMRYAFLGCTSLPSWVTADLTIPDGALTTGIFEGCAHANAESDSAGGAGQDNFMQAYRMHT